MVHGIHIEEMLKGLAAGHRRTLSRVITLIESQREEDAEVKSLIMKSIGEWRKSAVKIGITGSPGVGKSTFLNGFVQLFEGTPYQIAILSIDPSSTTTGGSILGDKIRMTNLIEMEQVFIRPSPSKGILGGINVNTWETVLICEAAGFDYIFIETVGVGQSEIEIQYLTNEVWYLTMARSGDEIQTMKRGLMEIVDRIIVTKVDLEPDEAR
ncbi:MAG TPA: GTP-binding protein, partial [Membranihabitans sp.]|nr:GTP-binding protein [Membranihabitans sp.]